MAQKFTPNSFQVPNAIIDQVMKKVTSNAFKCYMLIVRQTTGWNKEKDRISMSQLQSKTGLTARTIMRAMNELIDLNLIERLHKNGKVTTYKLVTLVSHEKQKPVTPMSHSSDTDVTRTSDTGVTLQNTTKQNTTSTKGVMAPCDFAIDENLAEWITQKQFNFDIAIELEKFKNHEYQKPKKDWNAAFRNWLLNTKKYEDEKHAKTTSTNANGKFSAASAIAKDARKLTSSTF